MFYQSVCFFIKTIIFMIINFFKWRNFVLNILAMIRSPGIKCYIQLAKFQYLLGKILELWSYLPKHIAEKIFSLGDKMMWNFGEGRRTVQSFSRGGVMAEFLQYQQKGTIFLKKFLQWRKKWVNQSEETKPPVNTCCLL